MESKTQIYNNQEALSEQIHLWEDWQLHGREILRHTKKERGRKAHTERERVRKRERERESIQ